MFIHKCDVTMMNYSRLRGTAAALVMEKYVGGGSHMTLHYAACDADDPQPSCWTGWTPDVYVLLPCRLTSQSCRTRDLSVKPGWSSYELRPEQVNGAARAAHTADSARLQAGVTSRSSAALRGEGDREYVL